MLTKKDFRSSIELKWRVHQIELSVFPVLFILIIFIFSITGNDNVRLPIILGFLPFVLFFFSIVVYNIICYYMIYFAKVEDYELHEVVLDQPIPFKFKYFPYSFKIKIQDNIINTKRMFGIHKFSLIKKEDYLSKTIFIAYNKNKKTIIVLSKLY